MTFPLPLPLEGDRVRIDPADAGGEARLVRLTDGARAGFVRAHRDGHELTMDALVVEPALRGYGLGSEAALLLRRAAEQDGVTLLRAWAPPDIGLAVYFWCRMGLHPLHGPGPDSGLAFERRLTAPPGDRA